MALNATFTIDTTKWDAALKSAQAGLKSFELTGKGVQRQLEQMTKGFAGANIKKEADLAAAAVKSIGGASKLTEAEQRKVNATVTEAIAKYKALGQQAPAELRKLQAETQKAVKETGLLGTAAGKAGALLAATFTIGAVTSAISKTVAYASSIKDMANQTGIGVERLQELKFAAEQSGVSFDSVGTAIFNIQKTLGKGGDGVTGALGKLGLTLKDIKSLSPEDQFQVIASKLGDVKSESDRVAIGTTLMGKSFKDVLPLIREGIDEQIAKAREWGVVIDENAINALENLGDAWDAVKLKGTALIAQAMVPMVPAITAMLNAVGPLISKFSELPAVFLKAEIGFNRFLQQQAEGAVKLLQLSKFSPAGLTNLVTGNIDKQIGEARLVAAGYRGIVQGLEKDLANLGKATKEVKPPFKAGDEKPIVEMDKAVKALQDRISGAAIVKSLRDLEKAWRSLTPAQKATALEIGIVTKEYQSLAAQLPKLPPDLRAFAVEMNTAAEQSGLMAVSLGELKPIIQSLGPTLDKTGRAFEDFGADIGFEGRAPLIPFYKGLGEVISRLPDSIKPVVKETSNWRESLEDVAQAFATLAQVSGGTLSKIFAGIGKTVAATNLMVKSIDSMKKGMDGIDKAENLGDTIAGFAELTTGILGAAAAAIELGKALWDAFTKSRAEQTAERIGREFGVAVSEEFAQTIENETAKFFGNRQAAQIFNLDRIIAEGGGLSAENIQPLFARFRDLFSMIEIGAFTGAQAVEVLDKNFRQFADFVTEGGSLASKELLEIINLTERFGLKSSEVSAFIVDQTGTALGGLTTFLDNAQVKTQAAADGIAGAIFGIFEAQSANGVPAAQIIKDLDPLIKDLDAQLVKAGLSGGEAFRLIKDLAAVASHEIAGPMITGILGLDKALAGLHNSGVLNEDMFDGLTAAVSDTYAEILATGVNGEKALQLIAPTLQTAWELSEDFGYSLDDNTQKLVDEAKAAGLVGDEHRTATEKMLIAMDRIADSIDALVKGFGFTLPKAIDGTADAIDNLPNEVTIVGRYIPPDFQGGGGEYPTEVVPMAAGGIGRVTKPTLFLAGEAGPEEYAFSGANQRFGSGSGGGGGVTVYLTVQAWDGNDVIRVAKGGLLLEALADGVNARSGGAMRLVGSISDASRVARR